MISCLAARCLALVLAKGDAAELTWQGKSHALDALPSDIGAAAREAVKAWSEFACSAGYRMALSADARVLLISATSDSVRARHEQLIASTTALFDRLLPAPARRSEARVQTRNGNPAARTRDDRADVERAGEIPEDPEEPRASLVAVELSGTSWEYETGSITVPMDRDTIVIAVLRKEDDYRKILDHLQSWQPYLASFARMARRLTGFVLEQPLTGAFLEAAAGMEEWNPENELVNRLAQLLLIRRFRQQPFWLQQGFGWYAELSILNGIYCFPYRQSFVSVGEHSGWDRQLQNDFTKRTQPLAIDDFALWRRDAFDASTAHIAWGVVDCLVRARAAVLPALLEDLRVEREQHGRRDNGDGTWTSIPGYEIPGDVQRTILERHAGKTFLGDVTAQFCKPRHK